MLSVKQPPAELSNAIMNNSSLATATLAKIYIQKPTAQKQTNKRGKTRWVMFDECSARQIHRLPESSY